MKKIFKKIKKCSKFFVCLAVVLVMIVGSTITCFAEEAATPDYSYLKKAYTAFDNLPDGAVHLSSANEYFFYKCLTKTLGVANAQIDFTKYFCFVTSDTPSTADTTVLTYHFFQPFYYESTRDDWFINVFECLNPGWPIFKLHDCIHTTSDDDGNIDTFGFILDDSGIQSFNAYNYIFEEVKDFSYYSIQTDLKGNFKQLTYYGTVDKNSVSDSTFQNICGMYSYIENYNSSEINDLTEIDVANFNRHLDVDTYDFVLCTDYNLSTQGANFKTHYEKFSRYKGIDFTDNDILNYIPKLRKKENGVDLKDENGNYIYDENKTWYLFETRVGSLSSYYSCFYLVEFNNTNTSIRGYSESGTDFGKLVLRRMFNSGYSNIQLLSHYDYTLQLYIYNSSRGDFKVSGSSVSYAASSGSYYTFEPRERSDGYWCLSSFQLGNNVAVSISGGTSGYIGSFNFVSADRMKDIYDYDSDGSIKGGGGTTPGGDLEFGSYEWLVDGLPDIWKDVDNEMITTHDYANQTILENIQTFPDLMNDIINYADDQFEVFSEVYFGPMQKVIEPSLNMILNLPAPITVLLWMLIIISFFFALFGFSRQQFDSNFSITNDAINYGSSKYKKYKNDKKYEKIREKSRSDFKERQALYEKQRKLWDEKKAAKKDGDK